MKRITITTSRDTEQMLADYCNRYDLDPSRAWELAARLLVRVPFEEVRHVMEGGSGPAVRLSVDGLVD